MWRQTRREAPLLGIGKVNIWRTLHINSHQVWKSSPRKLQGKKHSEECWWCRDRHQGDVGWPRQYQQTLRGSTSQVNNDFEICKDQFSLYWLEIGIEDSLENVTNKLVSQGSRQWKAERNNAKRILWKVKDKLFHSSCDHQVKLKVGLVTTQQLTRGLV